MSLRLYALFNLKIKSNLNLNLNFKKILHTCKYFKNLAELICTNSEILNFKVNSLSNTFLQLSVLDIF
jgi:hypothetical protein